MSDTYPQYRWAALGFLPIWTILANAVVLCCFYRERSLRQNLSNFIIASMALADVLLGIFVLPFAVYMKVTLTSCDFLNAYDRSFVLIKFFRIADKINKTFCIPRWPPLRTIPDLHFFIS
ncbi:adrenoceptor alpha [Cichlidogyrus casuarinus]|uniref:Adrenoceptor alpha n=1 Tax=Cichlidogyrus casuarinus TaxID=1844966 RepID=A0ABD2Q2D1_9PLAT